MKIAVVGTGYVGLVTGTCFAETGNDVMCVDIDAKKVEGMKNGVMPIFEPGLDLLFERNIRQGRLKFTTDLKEGIQGAKVIFLALPTPPGEDGSADLKYILGVADELGSMLHQDFTIVVDKSTVPVGTAEKVKAAISKKATKRFEVISNPEFLREGVAVDDFMKPDRVVLGIETKEAEEVMNELYGPFVRQGHPIIFMDIRSAELTKYAANAFLATKITFMNEIANLAEKVGADVENVRRGIGSDDRIGKRFLFAGIGYGGSCFPKDVLALSKTATENNYDFKILNAVMDVNTKQKVKLFPNISNYFKGDLKGKKIAMWGLAFKPNTDDVREAPAFYLIDKLVEAGASVTAFDPEAMENVQSQIGDKIAYASNMYEAIDGADALLIVTEWSVFRSPDFEKIASLLKNKAIFDGRNLFEPSKMKKIGFHYECVGRASSSSL